MATSKRSNTRRLTVKEQDDLIRWRLSGVPGREVAKRLNITEKTVSGYWVEYLRSVAEYRRDLLEEDRAELELRYEQLAAEARDRAAQAMDEGLPRVAAAWAAEERQCLREIARIRGLDLQKVEHSGRTDGTVEFVWREEIVKPGGE